MSTATSTRPPQLDDAATPDLPAVKNPWLVVTVREIMVKLTDRNFLLSTGLTVVLIVAGIGLSAFLGSRTADHTVVVTSSEGREIAAGATEAITADDSGDTLTITEVADEAAARQQVLDGEVDVALVATDEGWSLVGRESVDGTLSGALSASVTSTVLDANAQAAGTTVDTLTAGSEVTTELLEGSDERNALKSAAAFTFAFLFYMAAIIFGMAIANSVLEEKQNRVVEILATAIPIRQLLYGKVVGNSLLAFAQIGLFALVALIGLNITGAASDFGWLLGASGWFIAFFVVGFTALAAVWAVLGSLASRSEDLQSNTGPITTVIMVALFVGIFADGVWLTAASYVPVVSSVAMPVRLLHGDVPIWEPIVSLLVVIVTAYALLRLGERVYQRAVMQGGTALKWRQALKLEV
ncbi:ABC transporter permease [Sanguibacter suarezii]|uniref:ABC transporter permease n=1 Tax=Sanguibacter suarezii TaxID=60921 RepID=UPI000A05935F|nr:ABC transporter permease [Sanguibacter suarezii]